jgi:hypothetical protein
VPRKTAQFSLKGPFGESKLSLMITAWDGKMWDLEKAIALYDDWLNFVNFHFLFEDHPTKMTMDMDHMV